MTDKNRKPEIRFAGFCDDWEQCKFSDVVCLFGGNAFSSQSSVDSGARWLKIANVSTGQLKWNDESFLPTSYLEEYSSYRLKVGDYVMALTRPILNHELKIAEIVGDDILLNQRVAKLIFSGDAKFGYQMLRKSSTVDKIENELAGTDPPNLSTNTLNHINVRVPSLTEQIKIGTFFKNIDNLITFHQNKYDKLLNIKKAMLENMFPNKKNDIPKMRFKGYTDVWEQCEFEKAFSHIQNNSFSRAQLNYSAGETLNVHYGDVLTKFSECLDVQNDELPFITNEEVVSKYKASYLLNGDIIIADAAEDETVGKCCEIQGLKNEKILSGLHTIPCRPRIKFASGYLGFYLNSSSYHDKLLPLMQGTKVNSISKSALKNTTIVYPKNIEEQEKISSVFKILNNLITLQHCQLVKLKNIKKACLEKMLI